MLNLLCNPGLSLLFLRWVTKRNKHLEGQNCPAVNNIGDLACQHGNLFVSFDELCCWVRSLAVFWVFLTDDCQWVSGSGKQLDGSCNCLCRALAQMPSVLDLTQIKSSDYQLDLMQGLLGSALFVLTPFHQWYWWPAKFSLKSYRTDLWIQHSFNAH